MSHEDEDEDHRETHAEQAETLLRRARRLVKANAGEPTAEAAYLVQVAQVHATLALDEAKRDASAG
ncbi:MAG: hypothetical protein WKF94_02880 [Solirubrobacteraceae bacterium]